MSFPFPFQDYKEVAREEFLVFFKGALSQRTLVDLGSFIRGTFADRKSLKSVFSIFVEMAHNIIHYSAETMDDEGHTLGVGVFAIKKDENWYIIRSGNLISREDVPHVQERLKELAPLDKSGLQKLYKERRSSGVNRHAKGAGLGLIEMARRSEKPLEYSFQDYDETRCFFTLTAHVK